MNIASPQPQEVDRKTSALDQLEHLYKPHMLGVNELIVERFQSDIALIPQIATYLIAAGGKRIRPLLTLAAASFSPSNNIEKAYGFAAAVEFIHSATLLHDDVVDESDQRRGKKSANLVYGNQATVLVGDFLFSKSFELMVEGQNLDALHMLSNASAIIAEGEVLQLSHIGNTSLTEDEYFKIIECKTAALFRAATKSGAIITDQPIEHQNALYEYGHNLGLCFQIADDVIDYISDEQNMGKMSGDDFREGKLTLPVIYALQKSSEQDKRFLAQAMKNARKNAGYTSDKDFQSVLDIIHKHDCIAMCLDKCAEYEHKAKEALDILPNTPTKIILLDLLDEVIHRAS